MKSRSVKTADEPLGGSDENSQECETHLDSYEADRRQNEQVQVRSKGERNSSNK